MTILGLAGVARRVRRHCPALWRLAACGDDSGRSLCCSSCLAVITFDLKVLEGWLQNQQLLVIMSLINL